MCIIIQSKTGILPNLDRLKLAYSNNPHGLGLMWVEDGRVRTFHQVPKKFDDVVEALRLVEGTPWALHLRWVTRGHKSLEQCHPFKVASFDEVMDGDLYLMHNGTMSFLDAEVKLTGKSDTEVFADMLRRVAYKLGSTDELFTPSTMAFLTRELGTWNKVVFLDNLGEFKFLNKDKGWEDDNFWYSNTYSFQPGYRANSLLSEQFSWSSKKAVTKSSTTTSGSTKTVPAIKSSTKGTVSSKSSTTKGTTSASSEGYVKRGRTDSFPLPKKEIHPKGTTYSKIFNGKSSKAVDSYDSDDEATTREDINLDHWESLSVKKVTMT